MAPRTTAAASGTAESHRRAARRGADRDKEERPKRIAELKVTQGPADCARGGRRRETTRLRTSGSPPGSHVGAIPSGRADSAGRARRNRWDRPQSRKTGGSPPGSASARRPEATGPRSGGAWAAPGNPCSPKGDGGMAPPADSEGRAQQCSVPARPRSWNHDVENHRAGSPAGSPRHDEVQTDERPEDSRA